MFLKLALLMHRCDQNSRLRASEHETRWHFAIPLQSVRVIVGNQHVLRVGGLDQRLGGVVIGAVAVVIEEVLVCTAVLVRKG